MQGRGKVYFLYELCSIFSCPHNHATVITDKMVPTIATGDHTVRPHKQIAIHMPFNICTPFSLTLTPLHPSSHAHIRPPPFSMAMATSYCSMASPPITSKIPFLSIQVHCPKQTISFVLCLLFVFSLSHSFFLDS